MTTTISTITIGRVDDYTYYCESTKFSENKLTECQLMTLLGAILGVTITDPNKSNSIEFRLDVTMISPD